MTTSRAPTRESQYLPPQNIRRTHLNTHFPIQLLENSFRVSSEHVHLTHCSPSTSNSPSSPPRRAIFPTSESIFSHIFSLSFSLLFTRDRYSSPRTTLVRRQLKTSGSNSTFRIQISASGPKCARHERWRCAVAYCGENSNVSSRGKYQGPRMGDLVKR